MRLPEGSHACNNCFYAPEELFSSVRHPKIELIRVRWRAYSPILELTRIFGYLLAATTLFRVGQYCLGIGQSFRLNCPTFTINAVYISLMYDGTQK